MDYEKREKGHFHRLVCGRLKTILSDVDKLFGRDGCTSRMVCVIVVWGGKRVVGFGFGCLICLSPVVYEFSRKGEEVIQSKVISKTKNKNKSKSLITTKILVSSSLRLEIKNTAGVAMLSLLDNMFVS